MQPGFRSPWGRYVGGAGKPTGLPLYRGGDRSPLFFWGGGAAKPLSSGEYAGPRSMLAFWMGGAALNYFPRPLAVIGPDGPSFLKHHEREKRSVIDDDEVVEFLRLWVVWNDIEGP